MPGISQQLGDLTRCDRCARIYELKRCPDCDESHSILKFKRNPHITVDHTSPFCVECIDPTEALVMQARERDIERGRANN